MHRSGGRGLHTMLIWLAIAGVTGAMGCASSAPPVSPPGAAVDAEKGVVVKLVEGQGCDPKKGELKRSNGRDHVRWHNPGTTERTITFTAGWPFIEGQSPIVIPAGGRSEWFSLNLASSGDFPYKVEPLLTNPGDPPDGPVISAGD